MATAIKLAAILLVAGLYSQSIDAGHLSDIKGLFRGHEIDQSYRILADHLYKATQSTKLEDNTKAAESLLSEHPDAPEDLIKLVDAFKSLKGDMSDPASLCSNQNLANRRLVANAMHRGGNLGPHKITKPILRLNRIIVELIADSQPICPAYLDTKWTRPWKANFTDELMRSYINELQRLSVRFAFGDYLGKPKDPRYVRLTWGHTLSGILEENTIYDGYSQKILDPDCPDPATTLNKTVLTRQLQEYIYKPCEEFVTFQELHDVLEPYNDMLMSYNLVRDDMDDYFANEDSPNNIDGKDKHNYLLEVKKLAVAYAACKRFLVMPVKVVLHQLRESRKMDKRIDENLAEAARYRKN